MSRGCGRGCLLSILAAIVLGGGGISWLMSGTGGDPFAIAYLFSNANGAISKWEKRPAKIVKIERQCSALTGVEQSTSIGLTEQDCSSAANLQKMLAEKIRPKTLNDVCFKDRNLSNSKNCLGEIDGLENGSGTVLVESSDASGVRTRASIAIMSRQKAFYMFKDGDVVAIEICTSNPTIARLPLTGSWWGTKGC